MSEFPRSFLTESIVYSVTSIGSYAFYSCGALGYVAFAGGAAPSCGSYVFSYTAISSVHVRDDYSGGSVCGMSSVYMVYGGVSGASFVVFGFVFTFGICGVL